MWRLEVKFKMMVSFCPWWYGCSWNCKSGWLCERHIGSWLEWGFISSLALFCLHQHLPGFTSKVSVFVLPSCRYCNLNTIALVAGSTMYWAGWSQIRWCHRPSLHMQVFWISDITSSHVSCVNTFPCGTQGLWTWTSRPVISNLVKLGAQTGYITSRHCSICSCKGVQCTSRHPQHSISTPYMWTNWFI